MDFDNDDNDETVVHEDRLSTLPDELIHQILGCIDTKFAVQTCLLSPRWKLLWTTMPYLNFDSDYFNSFRKFAKFVKHVLTRRNHHMEVSSVKLRSEGAASQVFVRQIAKYVFAHNVQELIVDSCPTKNHKFPLCLISSPSLKSFTFTNFAPCLTPKTPWNFPALTSLHLSQIIFCDSNTKQPVDLFSKCVNLKNLTLQDFDVDDVGFFNIISPQLSHLMLIDGRCPKVLNLITPQLENLTIIDCFIKYLNAPPGLTSFSYRDYRCLILPKDYFHSLNKVNVYLCIHPYKVPYTDKLAREIINMLQELHSAKFLTLNIDILECLSAHPGLLSQYPSPFSNLLSLNIDSRQRDDVYNFKVSAEARNFLLEKSPSATFFLDLPEEPARKAMRQRDSKTRRKAELVADVESRMRELQASLEHVKTMVVEKKQVKEKIIATLAKLTQEAMTWAEKRRSQCKRQKTETQMQVDTQKLQIEIERADLVARSTAFVVELKDLVNQEREYVLSFYTKKCEVEVLLDKLREEEYADIEYRYAHEFIETVQQQFEPLFLEMKSFRISTDDPVQFLCDLIINVEDVADDK